MDPPQLVPPLFHDSDDDFDSDAEDADEQAPPNQPNKDYEPSQHRGPGSIEDATDAKTLRQIASQHMTVSKKRKIKMDTGVSTSKAYVSIVETIGGEGAIIGGYLRSRHSHSKKGVAIGPTTKSALKNIFTKDGAEHLEMTAIEAQPKFAVGEGHVVGNKSSPPIKPTVAAKLGFQAVLRGPLDRERGLRLAAHGVNMYAMFRAELQNQDPAGPPPTRDEILAAIQISLLDAPYNSTKVPADRIPVNDR